MLSRPLSYQDGIPEGALYFKILLEFSVKQFDSRVNHEGVLIMQYLVRVVNITHRLTNMLIVRGTSNDQGRHRVHSFRDYSTLQYKSLQHESLPLRVMTSKHKDRYKGSPNSSPTNYTASQCGRYRYP